MVIDVKNVQYNDGFLPDIILSVDPMLLLTLLSGNPSKCHEEFFFSLQPMIPPKRLLDIFSPRLGDTPKV